LIQETESNDQSRQLDDRIFRNFSQSYVSLSNENAELRRQLGEQKQSLLGNQSEIDQQQTAIQQLQSNLASSSDQIEVANQSRLQATEDLQQKNKQLQSIKQRLLDTSRTSQKQQEEILQLKRNLALLNEEQQQSLKAHQESIRTTALERDGLINELQSLDEENKTLQETLTNERAQRDKSTQDAKIVQTNLTAEKRRLEGRLEQSKAQLALSGQQQTELMQQMEEKNKTPGYTKSWTIPRNSWQIASKSNSQCTRSCE